MAIATLELNGLMPVIYRDNFYVAKRDDSSPIYGVIQQHSWYNAPTAVRAIEAVDAREAKGWHVLETDELIRLARDERVLNGKVWL